MPAIQTPKISVVIPCLNEELAVASCIEKAREALERLNYPFEIVVCDNASTDKTAAAAEQAGARVVFQPRRGYGAAYLKGIENSRGDWIIMGDGDDSYDFSQLAPFVKELASGADLVMGSRFKGTILPGAMPWLHQYVGNPFLSGLLNLLFGLQVSDSHCGMRALTRAAFQKMNLITTGMEFASEMVIKAAQSDLRIAEVPIVYHPREGESKLRSFRDGWRHLRFMLLYSPGALFLVPGTCLSVFGWFLLLALLGGPAQIWGRFFDYHFMFVGSLSALLGVQILQMGLIAKVIARHEGLDPKPDPLIDWLREHFDVDRGVIFGTVLIAGGFLVYVLILLVWLYRLFGPLEAVRPGIMALTLISTGAQTLFSSFFLGMLNIPHLQKPLPQSQPGIPTDRAT